MSKRTQNNSDTIETNRKSSVIPILQSLTTLHADNLVIFMGNGVSCTATPQNKEIKSWEALLKALLRTAKDLKLITYPEYQTAKIEIFKGNDLVKSGGRLTEILSSKTKSLSYLGDCMAAVFNNLNYNISEPGQMLYNAIIQLVHCGSLLMTLNYDTFFQTFARSCGYRFQTITPKDIHQVQKWANGELKESILHINGVFYQEDTIAIDPSGYQRLLSNRILMKTFKRLYGEKVFLFLGYAFNAEDEVVQTVVQSAKKLRHYHFRFVATRRINDYIQTRKKFLELGIKLVPFGDYFPALPPYFRRLSALLVAKARGMDEDSWYEDEEEVIIEQNIAHSGLHTGPPAKRYRKTGFDPSQWGAKLEDRYYNNRDFNELAPPGGDSKEEQKEGDAAKAEEAIKNLHLEGSNVSFTEEQAATKIQALYRYKVRKDTKVSKELLEGEGNEPNEETSEPEKKEKE